MRVYQNKGTANNPSTIQLYNHLESEKHKMRIKLFIELSITD